MCRRAVTSNLSVEENLRVPLERSGQWDIERIYELFPRLAERRGNRGRQRSGGEQEMQSIARALLLNPKLLLLDEPWQGLAPLIVRDVFNVIRGARASGISVLLVEQNVRAALDVANRAYVIDDGRVIFAGSADDLAIERNSRSRTQAWEPAISVEDAPSTRLSSSRLA